MKKQHLFVLIIIVLTSFTIYKKDLLEDIIVKKLEDYSTVNYPEKIYIHTDKPYYSLGETIWFTSYMVNGIDHLKSKKSYVVHVDLINVDDEVIDSKKLHIEHISSAGDFKISKKEKSGKFILRAYTNEMRNEDADYFFQKEITVLTNKENLKAEEKKALETLDKSSKESMIPKPTIQFFPEGGYMVEGVKNNIALKIKDKLFHDKNLTGTIVDTNGNIITTFKTAKFGLGVISLFPEPNKTYTAIIDINGSEETYPLPKALKEGYVISTSNRKNKIGITVTSTLKEGLKGSFLVAHQRGKNLYNKLESSTKKSYFLSFPTAKLNDGIIHITLFNPEGNPVAERLLYVDNPNNAIKVSIKKDEKEISTREKITLNISPKDVNGNNVSGRLSMSVRDLEAIPQNNYVENIKTWLLLNSDLRGEIENPGYFFEVPNDFKRRYLLDLTMMTHGWRRFTWNSLLHEEQKPRKFSIEQGLYIKGKTKALKKPYDFRSAATRLTYVSSVPHQETIQSDSLGNFTFGPFVYYDSVPALIEARLTDFTSKSTKNRKVVILLENEELEKPEVTRKSVLKSTISDEEKMEAYQKISKYIDEINMEHNERMRMLDEVTIVAKRKTEKQIRDREYSSRTNYGTTNNRVVTDDLEGGHSFSILELLQRTSGVHVTGNTVTIRGLQPVFYLDGMEIDMDFVQSLSGSDIDFMDVLKGHDAAMFPDGSSGVIALYSKTGSSQSSKHIKRKPGIIDFQAPGFYSAREFYAPDHINGFEEMSRADVRTTLHWEPQIRVTQNKTADISFFSSDSKGDYIIELQGISDTGIPIHHISTITVK